MNKAKIISEYNHSLHILNLEYEKTDGAKYINTLPLDPYCQPYNMPKEKFPEYYKCREEMVNLNKKYNEIISKLAKYKKNDIVIVGCQDYIEFGKIDDSDFFINGGNDILYQIKFNKIINPWKFGSNGGGFGKDSCTCAFYENDILMKVSSKKMQLMQNIGISKLKKTYPELFPFRIYDKKRNELIYFIDNYF